MIYMRTPDDYNSSISVSVSIKSGLLMFLGNRKLLGLFFVGNVKLVYFYASLNIPECFKYFFNLVKTKQIFSSSDDNLNTAK